MASKLFFDMVDPSQVESDKVKIESRKSKSGSKEEQLAKINKSLSEVFDLKSEVEQTMVRSLMDELESSLRDDDDGTFEFAMRAASNLKGIRSMMSSPGKLGLPPLLERRRWEYGIVDGAFDVAPFYDRVLFHQISQFASLKISKDSSLYLPHDGTNEKHSNPEGILIAAGAAALDQIRSNGMDLGHRMVFLKLAPWHRRVAVGGGHEFYTLTLRAGDIVGSYDLRDALVSGDTKIKYDEALGEHYFVSKSGEHRPNRVKNETFVLEDY